MIYDSQLQRSSVF